MTIRVRTLWPHRVGGLTFWSPKTGYVRVNTARTHYRGEGNTPGKRGDHWPAGPGRDLRISWWRSQRALRRSHDKAARLTG